MSIRKKTWLKEFERNPSEIHRLLLLFWSFLIIGFGGLQFHGFTTALIWWILAIFHLANYVWARKTPLLRLTRDEMMIFSSMLQAPAFIDFEHVLTIKQPDKKKVIIVHSEQKKETLLLKEVRKDERMQIMKELQEALSAYQRQHPVTE